MTRILWGLTFFIVILSLVSVAGDSHNLLDLLFGVLWCSWGPIVLAAIYNAVEKNGPLTQYIFAAAFIGSFGFALHILGMTSSAVMSSGSLNESGLILIVIPFGYFKYSFIGGVCGAVTYSLVRFYRS